MLKLRKNKKGFTLVELIVVIAIMAVLAGTIAGVTVSQLNKQTNNTAKAEAQTLASDLYNFMIDYKLAGNISVENLKTAVDEFVTDNNQGANIKVFSLGENVTAPPAQNSDIEGDTNKGTYTVGNNFISLKSGSHQFYAVVYKTQVVVGKGEDNADIKEDRYKVRFCCLQKGKGSNQFPYADYTYGDVLADK